MFSDGIIKLLCTLSNKCFSDRYKKFLSPSILRKLSRDQHTKNMKARSICVRSISLEHLCCSLALMRNFQSWLINFFNKSSMFLSVKWFLIAEKKTSRSTGQCLWGIRWLCYLRFAKFYVTFLIDRGYKSFFLERPVVKDLAEFFYDRFLNNPIFSALW